MASQQHTFPSALEGLNAHDERFNTVRCLGSDCLEFSEFVNDNYRLYRYINNYSNREEMRAACSQKIKEIIQRPGSEDTEKDSLMMFVAAQMAFGCRLPCTETVVQIIQRIFENHKTFYYLFTGAIYDEEDVIEEDLHFGDREESLAAVEYFLYHITKGKVLFDWGGDRVTFANLPFRYLDNEGDVFAFNGLIVAMSTGNTGLFRLLLEYGADLHVKACCITPARRMEEFDDPKFTQIAIRAEPNTRKQVISLKALARAAARKVLIVEMVPIQDLYLPRPLIEYLQLKF